MNKPIPESEILEEKYWNYRDNFKRSLDQIRLTSEERRELEDSFDNMSMLVTKLLHISKENL